jgi:DNA end-binding protein Ku
MVSIPVRLYKAARRERVRFRHVYAPPPEPAREAEAEPEPEFESDPEEMSAPRAAAREFSSVTPVRETVVGADDDKPVPRSEILKGFETAKDEYVVFKPSEIAALRPRTSSELPIVEFVRVDEIDPIFFDTSYYLAPDKGGEGPFALLAAALAKTGYAAMGSLAMHGREHAVVIRAARQGLVLHTLFYANEVRADEAWRADAAVNEKELALATMLVESMEAPFDPSKLKDTFEERLRAMIDSRAPVPAPSAAATTPRAPAIDIMEALRKSIAAARKPVESERRPHREAKPAREKRRRA